MTELSVPARKPGWGLYIARGISTPCACCALPVLDYPQEQSKWAILACVLDVVWLIFGPLAAISTNRRPPKDTRWVLRLICGIIVLIVCTRLDAAEDRLRRWAPISYTLGIPLGTVARRNGRPRPRTMPASCLTSLLGRPLAAGEKGCQGYHRTDNRIFKKRKIRPSDSSSKTMVEALGYWPAVAAVMAAVFLA